MPPCREKKNFKAGMELEGVCFTDIVKCHEKRNLMRLPRECQEV